MGRRVRGRNRSFPASAAASPKERLSQIADQTFRVTLSADDLLTKPLFWPFSSDFECVERTVEPIISAGGGSPAGSFALTRGPESRDHGENARSYLNHRGRLPPSMTSLASNAQYEFRRGSTVVAARGKQRRSWRAARHAFSHRPRHHLPRAFSVIMACHRHHSDISHSPRRYFVSSAASGMVITRFSRWYIACVGKVGTGSFPKLASKTGTAAEG